MTERLVDPLRFGRPLELKRRERDRREPQPERTPGRKRRASSVTLLLAMLIAALVVVPAAVADDDDDDGGGGATPTTVTIASGPDWGQLVCLNDLSPPACPASAMRYGFLGAGWNASPRLHGSEWIWKSVTPDTAPAELDTATFSRTITLNGTPTSGEICLAADDYAELRVNGTLAGTVGSTTVVALAAVAQNTFTCFDVTAHLQPGANVITVFGQNGIGAYAGCTNCTYRQHPAGVVFYGQLTFLGDGDDDDDDDGDDDDDDDGGDDDD